MNQKKIKKRFYRQEKIRLQKRIFRIRVIVNEVLQESFDRRLYNLKHDDELRLLTLYAWRDRYKVNIEYILRLLIPIWSKKFSRFKLKTSLGCRVSTLVGKKSEEILRERIWRDFSNGENKSNWRQTEMARIEKIVGSSSKSKHKDSMGKSVKYKSILEAPNPEKFIKAYKRELHSKNKLNDISKKDFYRIKSKTYRNNPWID